MIDLDKLRDEAGGLTYRRGYEFDDAAADVIARLANVIVTLERRVAVLEAEIQRLTGDGK